MKRLISLLSAACAAGVLAAPIACAAEQEQASSVPASSQSEQTSVLQTVRQESLELPGLTACHQCEWRPHMHEQAAPEECGTSPDGSPKVGQFECGFSPDCERVCTFVTCVP